jgi:hypothetical protein
MNGLFELIMRLAALRMNKSSLGRGIMHWSSDHPPERYAGLVGGVPKDDVLLAISALRTGKRLRATVGWVDCRICGEVLGTSDLGAYGFVWPERSEHYIEEHGVWTPGLDELVRAAKSSQT